MKFDKKFVKSLDPSLNEVLPHSTKAQLAYNCHMTPLSISKICAGGWTNEKVIGKAIKKVWEKKEQIDKFLSQIPTEETE